MYFLFHKPVDEVEEFSTAGKYGLEILCAPENARADIVFVHGLTGNRENTWTHKKSGVFWPKDLLPEDLEKTRVLTFGYDADIVSAIDTASSNTLRNHGQTLAGDLARTRMRTKSLDRPLIFVAHGLGGLVVEQALLICRGAAQSYMKALLESTFGIIFMGTPHMGSDHARWADMLRRLSSVFRRTNSNLLNVLGSGSEMLATLQQEFHTMLDDRSRNQGKEMEIFCFFEELAVFGVGEIVPRQSAILSRYRNEGIHATHMDMTKFPASNDTGYDRVSGQLFIWCSDLPAQISAKEVRDKRVEKFATVQHEPAAHYSGNVLNNNRNVVQGNTTGNISFGSSN